MTVESSVPDRTVAPAHTISRRRARFLRRMTAATGGGMFLDGFVFACIAVVVAGQAFRQDMGTTPVWLGLISASTLVGTIIGGPLGGYLTDRIGRRPMFIADLCTFLVASVLLFFVQAPWQIVVLGLVLGAAVGADFAIGSPLLGEFAPAHNRGHYLGVLEILWNVGYVVAYFLGFLITRIDPEAWRWALALGAVPAAIVLAIRHGLPESPRWLMSKGRHHEAREILTEHLGIDPDTEEFGDEDVSTTSYRTLFTKNYLARTVFCCVFWSCIVLPYFAITFFQADILDTLGIADPVLTAVFGTCTALVGAVVGWYLIDRLGRRHILIAPMFITGTALLLVSFNEYLPHTVTIGCFFLYLLAYGVMSILPGVYPLEVFPTAVRTTGMGISTAASRIGSAIGTFLLPLSLVWFGLQPTVLMMAGVCVVGGISSILLAPETRGRALSDTGGPHAKKGIR